jgi:L-alanine-DL-glutamate epimerase-like enolase superfamily enzyme
MSASAQRHRAVDAAIDGVSTTVYRVPTATPEESDGTLTWDSTGVVVVEISADGITGLGYTYCDPAAADVIDRTLVDVLRRADPLMPERAFAQMQVQLRQLGHVGVAAMALSAVDIALWDLKAKLLGACLADALPRFHEGVPIYGSGGFTNLTDDELRAQIQEWCDMGLSRMKLKVGRHPGEDPRRIELAREVAGPETELMVDANGAFTPSQALEWAERFRALGVRYFEEPVSSQDLDGLARVRAGAPAGQAIAAGEYGWNLPYFERMIAAGSVDILQADVTRCGGITNMLRIDGLCRARNLPFSAHCAPAVSAHVCCAMESALHIEYFYDHYRIERMLFHGTLEPVDERLVPDRSRPGLGLELRRGELERHRVLPRV